MKRAPIPRHVRRGERRDLTVLEITVLRSALVEAIASVRASLDSNLPPRKSDCTAHERFLETKWKVRGQLYATLLQELGGPPRGETTLDDDFAALTEKDGAA